MYETGSVYRVDVTGYGPTQAVHLGRICVTDVQPGDFVRGRFMGGMTEHVVRVESITWRRKTATVAFDWNGWRDGRPGGSLLADDAELPENGMFKEVWRPES